MSGNLIVVQTNEMISCFEQILLIKGFTKEKAIQLAETFTNNSVDGVYTHGVNRFARFADYVDKGLVKKDAEPTRRGKHNGIEQWDGQLGPGILNAQFATRQCMKLADEFGIGCVGLSHTNHWMRGGTFGWTAAKKGYVFIGWTNTTGNLPAWGGKDARLGNNPLVMAIPYQEEAVVLDMAMSQFSFGSMELAAMKGEKLSIPGGFDVAGKITQDPEDILASRRPMPMGYWKGAGLSLLLDILAAVLSGGLSTHEINKKEAEYGVSQVFIAISLANLSNHSAISHLVENIVNDYLASLPADPDNVISYPGERVLNTRRQNLEHGIPVLKTVWEDILKLR